MKKLIAITAVGLSLAGSAFAGVAKPNKNVTEPLPVAFGLGWYGAVEAGANISQDLQTFNPYALIWDGTGTAGDAKANSNTGGAAGFKLGYVFDTGKLRPALEVEAFYNGFGFNYQGIDSDYYRGSVGGQVKSFAYMANFLLRYDLGRFQPYVGAGIGGYFGESDVRSLGSWDVNSLDSTHFNRTNTSWAWQLIAGADYYFTQNVSAFLEYKWLNYENFAMFNDTPQLGGGEPILPKDKSELSQQLLMLGIRIGLGAPSASETARVAIDGKDSKRALEPETYGLGWYGAVDAGLSLSQHLPTFDPSVLADDDAPGTSPTAGAKGDMGTIAGVKLGYVFDTGKIRPAVEADLSYNGFGYNYQGVYDGYAYGAVAGKLNSYVSMANVLLRYDAGRLQPYIGVGIGGYIAQSRVQSISSYELSSELDASFSRRSSSWAWQVLGGADYYFTPKMSAFLEYKWLNLENVNMFNSAPQAGSYSILPDTNGRLGQQLVSVGVRIHF